MVLKTSDDTAPPGCRRFYPSTTVPIEADGRTVGGGVRHP